MSSRVRPLEFESEYLVRILVKVLAKELVQVSTVYILKVRGCEEGCVEAMCSKEVKHEAVLRQRKQR